MQGGLQPTRRQVVLGSSMLAAGGMVLPSPIAAISMVSGCVYHDRSGNGRRHTGDPGIANVLVSNGVDVVRTDLDGQWRLPASSGEQIFVIKPPGWGVACGPLGLPRFSQCVPTLSYGAAAGSVDFGLLRVSEASSFEAALVADTQPQSNEELDYLRDSVLAAVAGTGATFAINHGDIVFDDPALYPRYLQLIAATDMPWHHCPGNHDMNPVVHDKADCFETWKALFGPTNYAFQQGRATFILLNNVDRLAAGPMHPSGYGYRGYIGERQLRFVRQVLSYVPRDDLIVISMHIPLIGFEDPNDPAGRTADCQELLQILDGRPHTVSFAGHTHTTEHHYLGRQHGFIGPGVHHHHVLTAASGSWWSGPADYMGQPLASSRDGTPKGFHVLSVDGNRYETRLITVDQAGPARMRISLTSSDTERRPTKHHQWQGRSGLTMPLEQLGTVQLAVNVFDGGPRTEVSYRVHSAGNLGTDREQSEVQMTRAMISDPFTIDLYTLFKSELKPWVEPAVSSHIWSAALPDWLTPGAHRVVVTARDEYGRRHSASTIIELTEGGNA